METRERTLGGRYRLEQVIGRGGMSTVYRATDDVLGRTVAVKVLLPVLAEQDRTYAARFEREARAAAALASSSVVVVYDTGVDEDGGHYIVMEYVPGRSLAELLVDGHPLEIAEALRVGAGVADALRTAHDAGILHRDIKPANVMVADDGAVKVLDFGIARRLDGTTLTQAASIVGTAAYMAPERALGQAGDACADIYSLGCLVYAMLTGGPPFAGEVSAAVLHQQVNAEPPPPSRLRPGIPPELDALVLEMLAKTPAARPQSAEGVRDRLLALAGAAPLLAAGDGRGAATAPLRPGPRAGPRAPVRTAATAPLARRGSARPVIAAVMAVATALVALLAVVLLSGGGSSANRAGHQPPARVSRHRAATTAAPHTASTPSPQTAPNAEGPTPAGPATGGPAPPGHGGQPPGQAKKHRDGGPGGPGGGGGDGGDGGD